MNTTFFLQLTATVVVIVLTGQLTLLSQIFDVWKPFMEDIEIYRAEGVTHLLEQHVGATSNHQKVQEFETLKKAFGYNINLSTDSEQALSRDYSARLTNGELIFDRKALRHYKLLGGSLLLTLENMDIPADHVKGSNDLGIRGSMTVLASVFAQTNETQWPALAQQFSKASQLPVRYHALEESALSKANQERLIKGEVIFISSALSDAYQFPGNLIYKKIPTSHQVLIVGPIAPLLEQAKLQGLSHYYLTLGLLITLPIALWFFPTWRSARHIRRASQYFGQGQLSARAAPVRASNLNQLSQSFNQMADNIQLSLEQNKMLTHAISHELRTPLTNLSFALELLTSSPSVEKQAKYLTRMGTCLQDLNDLASELDIYAKFDQNDLQLDTTRTDINVFLSDCTEKWQLLAGDIPFSLTPGSGQVMCDVDTYYLQRAIDNMVRNASRHARHRIHVHQSSANGGCKLYVENDGSPISDTDKLKIFDPFVRLEESRARDSGGTGLGLAIVAQIVVYHQGRIWVEDSELGGARFVIYLPASIE